MFKKILFATDGSLVCDMAAKTAFELSQKYDSELILLHVEADVSSSGSLFVPDIPAITTSGLGSDAMALVKQGMKKRYGSLVKKMAEPEYRVVQGEPFREILKFALNHQVDCIVMGVHGRVKDTAGKRVGITAGKTLKKVAQQAECPILSIARQCETSFWYFNQIIFGTDFSKASMSAFRFAYQLAEYIGCKLNIFHALELDPSITRVIPSQKQIEDQIAQAKTRIEELYVSQMHNFDNYHIVVWEGTPHVEILKFARETSGDLIVMAPHNRNSDSKAVFFGHTMEQVVLRSACPVISVSNY